MQVVDDVEGPMTKREFELFQVPVGETLLGQVCNFVGQSKSPQVNPLPFLRDVAFSQQKIAITLLFQFDDINCEWAPWH